MQTLEYHRSEVFLYYTHTPYEAKVSYTLMEVNLMDYTFLYQLRTRVKKKIEIEAT